MAVKASEFIGKSEISVHLDFYSFPVKFSCLELPVSSSKPLVVLSVTLSTPTRAVESLPGGYRKNVGICLVSPFRKMFTVSKIHVLATWQMAQGGADDGEDLRNAAFKELREKTGVTSAEFIAVTFLITWWFIQFVDGLFGSIYENLGVDIFGKTEKLFKITLP